MSIRKQHGFSMIEVLVAFIVLVFGILGMAGLQMQAINATEQGRYNGMAAMQAASISAAIKANPGYWGTPPTALIKVVGTTVSNGPAGPAATCADGVTICSAAQMAYFDLQTWGNIITNNLPVGSLQISCILANPPAPAVCTVQIIWQEKNVAGRNQDTTGSGDFATGATVKHSYQTVVSSL